MHSSTLRHRSGVSTSDQIPETDDNRHDQSKRVVAPQDLSQSWLVTTIAPLALVIIIAGAIILTHSELPFIYIRHNPDTKMYTIEELSKFSSRRWGRPLLLACMGKVYDVSAGTKYYGHGAGYHGFVGRDASKSFVTGDFKNDLTDDISTLTPEEHASVLYWRNFYDEHPKYRYVGRVIGRFYDAQGNPTEMLQTSERLATMYNEEKKKKEAEASNSKILCNVSWTEGEGGWVLCDQGMVPRKSKENKCVCYISQDTNEERRLYDGCEISSSRCRTA